MQKSGPKYSPTDTVGLSTDVGQASRSKYISFTVRCVLCRLLECSFDGLGAWPKKTLMTFSCQSQECFLTASKLTMLHHRSNIIWPADHFSFRSEKFRSEVDGQVASKQYKLLVVGMMFNALGIQN